MKFVLAYLVTWVRKWLTLKKCIFFGFLEDAGKSNAICDRIYMTESQKWQHDRVCQMCGDYESAELLHQISMMLSLVNLAKVKLY